MGVESVEEKLEEQEPMAPTASMETVSVVRKIKVVSTLLLVGALLFNILSIATTSWMKSNGRQEGLWANCVSPTGDIYKYECTGNESRGWLDACRILVCIAFVMTFIGLAMTTYGIQSINFGMKYKYYNIAIVLLFLAVIPELIAVIIFPVKFNEELNGAGWVVGWSYIMAVLSAVLVLIAAILLCVDRGADEALIREKTCYYNDESIEETLE
ncbi:peripheral myelin protein 22-like [Saccostrea cucullata]|uniref:peripheral myelin protein 22-like n=1 Tax=Saccostrea cuccullata TaxID=36930 RepID=UPI002ED06DE0